MTAARPASGNSSGDTSSPVRRPVSTDAREQAREHSSRPPASPAAPARPMVTAAQAAPCRHEWCASCAGAAPHRRGGREDPGVHRGRGPGRRHAATVGAQPGRHAGGEPADGEPGAQVAQPAGAGRDPARIGRVRAAPARPVHHQLVGPAVRPRRGERGRAGRPALVAGAARGAGGRPAWHRGRHGAAAGVAGAPRRQCRGDLVVDRRRHRLPRHGRRDVREPVPDGDLREHPRRGDPVRVPAVGRPGRGAALAAAGRGRGPAGDPRADRGRGRGRRRRCGTRGGPAAPRGHARASRQCGRDGR